MTHLVLASSSPRRRALLVAAGREPDLVAVADIDETPRPGESGAALVARLSAAKRDAVVSDGRPALDESSVVLAADTVVVLDGQVLGKPRDDDDARRMLHMLCGRTALVHSGIAVGGPRLPRHAATAGSVATSVRFRDVTAREVDEYVATGEPRGAAGAFRLQGAGAALIAATHGCPTNVVGLPVCDAARLLAPTGVELVGSCVDLVAVLRASDPSDPEP